MLKIYNEQAKMMYFHLKKNGCSHEDFLNLLQTSFSEKHQNAYDVMKDINIDDVEILGIVIYGTKDEIAEIIEKPFIKAISLGGVIDNY